MILFRTIIRTIFVSLEWPAAWAILIIASVFPAIPIKVGELLIDTDWTRYLACALPLAGLAVTSKLAKNVLRPSEATPKALYKWPKYKHLRVLVYVAMGWCALGLGVSFILVLFRTSISTSVLGTVYLVATMPWLLALISLWHASNVLPAILGGERCDNSNEVKGKP